MTERRQFSELNQRRQVCDRINELKSRCEYLSKIRDNLCTRLSELNNIVDRLLVERDAEKHNPPLKIDSAPNHIITESSKTYKVQREQLPQPTDTNDLIPKFDSSSRRDQNPCQKYPSDTFKMKLSQCLQEITPKAIEILEIGGSLYNSKLEK